MTVATAEKDELRLRRRKSRLRYIRENYPLYLMILPAIVFVFIFAYVPMYGIQIAFRDFKVRDGYWGSEWVGLEHIIRFVTSSNFWQLIRNTIGISLYSLAVGFPVPIILSVMLNELRSNRLRRTAQMIFYAPHFLSSVAVCGIVVLFTQRETGIINLLIMMLGREGVEFLAKPEFFKTIYVISGIWQDMGWGTIIYMAALSGVDPGIVEAATIDGANRLQKIWYIDIQTIKPTIVILLIFDILSSFCKSVTQMGILLPQIEIQELLAAETPQMAEKMGELIDTVCRELEGKRVRMEKDTVKLVRDYIEEQYADINLSQQMLADRLNMSFSAFGVFFGNAFGMPFRKYLSDLRIERSKKLLEETELNVKDICTGVGMTDPSYFTKIFKKSTGITPAQYREQSRMLG